MPDLLHTLHHQIRRIILDARSKANTAVNFAQVEAQWRIGQHYIQPYTCNRP